MYLLQHKNVLHDLSLNKNYYSKCSFHVIDLNNKLIV